MDPSPAPPASSAPLDRGSSLNRALVQSDLSRLASALAPVLYRRLPFPLRGMTSPDSIAQLATHSLVGLLECSDAEIVAFVDALALELGAWRYYRTANPDDVAATLAPIAERLL